MFLRLLHQSLIIILQYSTNSDKYSITALLKSRCYLATVSYYVSTYDFLDFTVGLEINRLTTLSDNFFLECLRYQCVLPQAGFCTSQPLKFDVSIY